MERSTVTRTLTILAQDPSVREAENGRMLRAKVQVPFEHLDSGPRGYRVRVTDYDSAQNRLYQTAKVCDYCDRFEDVADDELLSSPAFHAQNVYAIVMRILTRFEAALGRRVSWGFPSHQINVVPHAFAEANAYYSEEDRALMFGYFQGSDDAPVFTCLSHDVVAHETTHAILDGLKDSYTLPSSPDQAGFHEGFADVVALLSVFGLPEIVAALLGGQGKAPTQIDRANLEPNALRRSVLLGLAEQFGREASRGRNDALRRSVDRLPDAKALGTSEFEEAHVRGEIFSAAMLNAFVEVWCARLKGWLPKLDTRVPVDRVAEDGAEAAGQLLTIAIRALDYCPVVDVTFSDYLSALLTADRELVPDDGKYHYRILLRREFARWGILPATSSSLSIGVPASEQGTILEEGGWERPANENCLRYDTVHRDSLHRDRDEVFRLLWENRRTLGLFEGVHTGVLSVRPCVRLGLDGFSLHETVSEYMQVLDLKAGELADLRSDNAPEGIPKPEDMPDETPVRLYGGGVLVFDEFSRLKYHIRTRLDAPARQGRRLKYVWENGLSGQDGRYGVSDHSCPGQRFALMHLQRSGRLAKEEW